KMKLLLRVDNEFDFEFLQYPTMLWDVLYEELLNIFKLCSFEQLSNTSLLYRCKNSLKYISRHRLFDGYSDCYNSNDENDNDKLITFPLSCKQKNRFQCLFLTTQCIQRTLIKDKNKNCIDNSDELYPSSCSNENPHACQYQRGLLDHQISSKTGYEYVLQDICDGIISHVYNYETDETNCEHWPCYLFSTVCDGRKNCLDGKDEKGCIFTIEQQSMGKYHDDNDDDSLLIWYCNRGVMARTKPDNKPVCFCPPYYYGDRCQYQSNRLTVILLLSMSNPYRNKFIFKTILYLLNDKQRIVYYDEIMDKPYLIIKHLVYLIYPSLSTNNYSVHIETYIITTDNLKLIASWLYNIQFSFLLPVNRLVVKLHLEEQQQEQEVKNVDTCGQHGKAIKYLNINEYYCQCEVGWSGEKCIETDRICKNDSCSSNGRCIVVEEDSKCLCPLTKYGPTCRVRIPPCRWDNRCQHHSTCVSFNGKGDSNFNYQSDHICMCLNNTFDIGCSYFIENIYLTLPPSNNTLPFVMIHFANVVFKYPSSIKFSSQILFKNINKNLTIIQDSFTLSNINYMFIQVYSTIMYNDHYTLYFYHLLNCYKNDGSISEHCININKLTICLNIKQIFNQSVLSLHALQRLKYYNEPCLRQNNSVIHCFYDDIYICLCDHQLLFTQCYFFNHRERQCDRNNQKCFSDGYCIQDELSNHFACLCQRCTYGSLCQFRTDQYTVTLDALIDTEVTQSL
ncbi:unnamed protein product, partial [Didymodactylos carnosus]